MMTDTLTKTTNSLVILYATIGCTVLLTITGCFPNEVQERGVDHAWFMPDNEVFSMVNQNSEVCQLKASILVCEYSEPYHPSGGTAYLDYSDEYCTQEIIGMDGACQQLNYKCDVIIYSKGFQLFQSSCNESVNTIYSDSLSLDGVVYHDVTEWHPTSVETLYVDTFYYAKGVGPIIYHFSNGDVWKRVP